MEMLKGVHMSNQENDRIWDQFLDQSEEDGMSKEHFESFDNLEKVCDYLEIPYDQPA